jgi:hypothetical protein
MEYEIYQILKKHKLTLKKREEVLADLLVLFRVGWQSEQLMPKCTACNITPKHPVLGAHCKDSNCPHEH